MTRFRYRCPTRWSDLDAQAHVNNAIHLDYLQEARVEFLLSGPEVMHDLLTHGVLVVAHQVEYSAPIGFDGSPVTVELWVTSVGASRFEIGYELFHADRQVGRARTVATPYDLAADRLRRLHPEERAYLSAWLEPSEPLPAVDQAPAGNGAHRYPMRVRWSDLDSYGHVNNVKFFDYVQEARIALMIETLGFSPDEVWVVARQDLEYRRPIDFRREPYEVLTGVAAQGNRSFTLAVAIRDAETVYATARTVVVGPAPLLDHHRAALTRYAR